MPTPTNILFFKTPADLRKWFEKNHDNLQEQWIGYYKKDSGKPSITGRNRLIKHFASAGSMVYQSLDGKSYTIRFTPRRSTSIWSAINIKRVGELKKLDLMKKPGLEIFENRDAKKSNQYSFEQRKNPAFSTVQIKKFKANKKAWAFFSSQAPWYQRTSTWWIISAKQEETRLKRLAQLIKDSENGRTIPVLTRKK